MLSFSVRMYYLAKILIPRHLQIALRRRFVAYIRKQHASTWPIDERSAERPKGWTGWPDAKQFALVLTHDVESKRGIDNCLRLADLEESLGFRSAFNFVAEDYDIPSGLREELTRRGFEIGIHGLRHDGSLYYSRKHFLNQAKRINYYLKAWKAVGFRSPCMYRNLEWLQDLEIEYDASTFDTDPFEPQPDALGSIFPRFISKGSNGPGYVELPYTLPQDFTLYVLLQEKSIAIWKKKLDWIADKGGLALLITHPDYQHFGDGAPTFDRYSVQLYIEFLEYIKDKYKDSFWHILPKDLSRYWTTQTSSFSYLSDRLPSEGLN